MLRPLLLVSCLVALAFAGCAGLPAGMTAKSAVALAEPEALAWQKDAVLSHIIGLESHGLVGDEDPLGRDAPEDRTPGDGAVPAWIVSYASPSTKSRLYLEVSGDQVIRRNEAPSKGGADGQATAGAAAAWTIDSSDAVASLRSHNATADAALSGGGKVLLQYGFQASRGSWEINVAAEGLWMWAEVDAANGDVTKVYIHPGGGLGVPAGAVEPEVDLPAPIRKTGSTQAATDPLNLAQQPPCSSPSQECDRTPFTVNATAQVQARLTWGNQANDYDLYVMDMQDTIVLLSGQGPPGTEEAIDGELEPGEYQLVVVPWLVANDSWSVEATFKA